MTIQEPLKYSLFTFEQLTQHSNGELLVAFKNDVECFNQHFHLLGLANERATNNNARINRKQELLIEARISDASFISARKKPSPPSICKNPPYAVTILDNGHPYFCVGTEQPEWTANEYQLQGLLCLEVLTEHLSELLAFLTTQRDTDGIDPCYDLAYKKLAKAKLNDRNFNKRKGILLEPAQEKTLYLKASIIDHLYRCIQLESSHLPYQPTESVKSAAKRLANQLRSQKIEGKLLNECLSISAGYPLSLGHRISHEKFDKNNYLIGGVIESLMHFFTFPANKKEPVDVELVMNILEFSGYRPAPNTIRNRFKE